METERDPLWGAGVRGVIARQFTRVEDVVYIGLGVLLSACALTLLVSGAIDFVSNLAGGRFAATVIDSLDRILLILLVVEILYTVQVSFREHALVPEPFLIVGLIAATRRILVLTAEFKELLDKGAEAFRNGMIELGLLGFLVVALVVSLVLLRKRRADGGAPAAVRGEGSASAEEGSDREPRRGFRRAGSRADRSNAVEAARAEAKD
jgi:uncharacterized membrane protein (DUF373 family)